MPSSASAKRSILVTRRALGSSTRYMRPRSTGPLNRVEFVTLSIKSLTLQQLHHEFSDVVWPAVSRPVRLLVRRIAGFRRYGPHPLRSSVWPLIRDCRPACRLLDWVWEQTHGLQLSLRHAPKSLDRWAVPLVHRPIHRPIRLPVRRHLLDPDLPMARGSDRRSAWNLDPATLRPYLAPDYANVWPSRHGLWLQTIRWPVGLFRTQMRTINNAIYRSTSAVLARRST